MKTSCVALALLATCTGVFAEWAKIGENNRMLVYADTAVKRSGENATGWILFDYKTIQQSPTSGKRYLSEKDQTEVNCRAEQKRTIFFTWHADHMGDGIVVYTGTRPTEWEPTSSPASIGQSVAQYFCSRH